MNSYYEWAYIVEVEVNPGEWRFVNRYETEVEAVEDAKTQTRNSRVRQFKTTVFAPDLPLHQIEPESRPDSSSTPLIQFFCPTCTNQKVDAMKTSKPKCSICRLEMFMGTGEIK